MKVGRLSAKPDRDVLMQDFAEVETVSFPRWLQVYFVVLFFKYDVTVYTVAVIYVAMNSF